MKPTRIMSVMIVLILATSLSFAAGTPAGTAITNFATGDFKDLIGNLLPEVISNTVTTIVRQVAGVDVNPPVASHNLEALSSVNYYAQITNTGNGDDAFDLTYEVSGTTENYTIEIYHDIDGNGIIDGLDGIVATTGILAADASFDLIIQITDATGVGATDGDQPVITGEATSTFDALVSAQGIYTTTVTAASLVVNMGVTPDNPQPGEVITYSVCLENIGAIDAFNPVVSAPIPDNTTYVPGSIRIGSSSDYDLGTPQTDADDVDDNSDFNNTDLNTVTVGTDSVSIESPICVLYQVVINADVPVGTEIVNNVEVIYENDGGDTYPLITAGGGGGSIIVAQSYSVLLGDDGAVLANPGEEVLLHGPVTNTGNGTDVINMSYSSNSLTWTMYRDFNANGVIDTEDDPLTDTNADGQFDVGSVVSGQLVYIIAIATVPAGNSNGDVDVTTFTGTSAGDLSVTPAFDEAIITTTIIAPVITMTKTVDPPGDQSPGTVLTYRVDIHNLGDGTAIDGVVSDAIPDNTTYVANSMALAGVPKTDASDSDQGSFVGNAVVFTIPTLGASGSTFATFQVTID